MDLSPPNTLSSVEQHRAMLRIRLVEQAIAERYAEQQMRCPMHLCIGQEAIAVGVCAALQPDDKVFSNHRAHGHYLAKGGSLKAMLAELYGRATGCCGGRGGSMHLIDLDVGFMGATPIVGGTVPLAVGSAWASRLQRQPGVTVVFFGDGCFEEGVIHESLNFAALHKLPIVFVCENNQFSVYTRLNERQPDRPIYPIAAAHGLRAASGNGNDLDAVLGLAQAAIGRARAGAGPQFLELHTYRWREHCGPNFDDNLGYRSDAEVSAGLADCPILAHARQLAAAQAGFLAIRARQEADICAEIEEAFGFALASPASGAEQAGEMVYA
jgi:pyruvate dehydrogenase E1 component alpha subunit